MKHHNSKSGPLFAIVIMFFIVPLLLSCGDDDDEANITVCNLDNNEYDVELRLYSDDSVVGVIHLEEWYDPLEHCDTFEDVNEGRYYLAVVDSGNVVVDQSDDFYLSEGEHETFNIDTSGDILSSLYGPNEATVTVCNLDNLDSNLSFVFLKRSSDESLVAEFNLGDQQDAPNQCIDFEDLAEGSYYLEIDDDQSTQRSDDFYLAPDGSASFAINQDGELTDR